MWRPKKWKTLKAKNYPLHCLAADDCVGQSFEAGADAMLRALEKLGVIVYKGELVFRIPNGEKEE